MYIKNSDIAFQKREFKKAIELYTKAIQQYTQEQEWSMAVYCYNKLAECYYYENKPAERLQAASKAVTYARQYLSKTDPGFAEAFQQKGDAFFVLGMIDSTRYYLQHAQALFLPIQRYENYVSCQIGLAACAYTQRNYQSMQSHLDKGYKIASQKLEKINKNLSVIFHLYGLLYQQTGNFDRGLINALNGLQIRLKIHNISYTALANDYNNIGVLYNAKGDWDKAYEYYMQALNLYWENDKNHVNLIDVYNNIGLYFYKTENYPNAILYLKKSWQLSQNHKLPLSDTRSSSCLNTLILAYLKTNKVDSAEYYMNSFFRGGFQDEFSLRNAATVHNKKKASQLAKQYIQQAITIALNKYGTNHYIVGTLYNECGKILVESGSRAEALAYYEKAFSIFTNGVKEKLFQHSASIEKITSKAVLLTTLQLKAEALSQTSQQEKALQTYQQAAQLIDYLRLEHTAEGSKLHLAKLAVPVYEGAIETAYALYQQTHQESYLEAIFIYSEKNKAILLLDALRETQLKKSPALPGQLVELEEGLIRDKSLYQRKIAENEHQAEPDSLKLATWRQKLFLVTKRHDSLTTAFEQQYPAYYRLKYDHTIISLATVRSQLLKDPKTAVISYFVGEKHIFAIGIYTNRIVVQPITNSAAIFATIKTFRESLNPASVMHHPDSAYRNYTQSGYQLYQWLVAPVLQNQPKPVKQLIIIPSNVLGYIPFEALLTSAPRSHTLDYSTRNLSYLIQPYTISYGYSAYWLIFSQTASKQEKSPLKPFAGFAPSFTGTAYASVRSCDNGRLNDLTCNTNEVSGINEMLAGDAFLQQYSLKEKFLSEASQYRILHLATHACLDDHDPMMHRIYFSNGSITASELYHLPLHAEMVVLSACNSGVGKLATGEGFMSISRAFAYAGVPSMVISLWSVDDCSTSTLMKIFYQNLKKGLPKDEALRQAKLQYMQNSDNLTSNPFFWAGFVHVGNTTTLTETGFSYSWLIIAVALLFAFILAFFLRKRLSFPIKK